MVCYKHLLITLQEIARCDVPNKDALPFPTTFIVNLPGRSKDSLARHVNSLMNDLDLRWQWRASVSAGVGLIKENVWSRAARRKRRLQSSLASHGNDAMEIDDAHRRAKSHNDETMDIDEEQEDVISLAVKITAYENKVEVRWLKGYDSVLYESFCGMLKRGMTN